MSPLWAAPVAVVVLFAIPLVVLARRAAAEAARLRRSVDGWTALQPALVEVRTELDILRAQLREQHRR